MFDSDPEFVINIPSSFVPRFLCRLSIFHFPVFLFFCSSSSSSFPYSCSNLFLLLLFVVCLFLKHDDKNRKTIRPVYNYQFVIYYSSRFFRVSRRYYTRIIIIIIVYFVFTCTLFDCFFFFLSKTQRLIIRVDENL